MFTIHQTNDTVKFIFYTLAITEDMINKREAGNIATQTICNLIESDIYQKTKIKLLQIHGLNKIDLPSDEFYTFCILVDFTSRCFVSEIFSGRLREIHKSHPFETNSAFDEMKKFYLRYATEYFKSIKMLYNDKTEVLETIELATDWIMNDEDFKER